jgi:hypothetical protein
MAFLVEVSDEEIRRERQKARDLRVSQWWKRKRATRRCHHCGGTFAPSALTMDHLVPIVRGGKSSKGNVVPSCKACNTARDAARDAPCSRGSRKSRNPRPTLGLAGWPREGELVSGRPMAGKTASSALQFSGDRLTGRRSRRTWTRGRWWNDR